MRRAKATPNGVGLIHGVYRATGGARAPRWVSLCGVNPTAPDMDRPARWGWTENPIGCARCLAKLEALAEQAIRDTAAISAIAELAASRPGHGSPTRFANPDTVRTWRRAWPLMGRAVAMLLRDRGVQLGEGWTGPTRGPAT